MFKSAFQQLHDYYKTHDAIAKVFKVTRQNVGLWKKNGIPSNRALEIEQKTNGKVKAMDVLRG